jgi:DNA polymerase
MTSTSHWLEVSNEARESGLFFLDLETQSPLDIRKVGAPVYARSVESVICMAYALNDGPVQLWTPGSHDARQILLQHRGLFVAHNVEFEAWVIREFWGIDLPPERWIDSAAVARWNNLPGKLEEVGKFYGFEKGDASAMLRICKPRRPSKTNPDRYWTPQTRPDLFSQTYRYCMRDVEVSRHVLSQSQVPPPGELALMRLTQRMNRLGMPVDLEALEIARGLAHADQERLRRKCEALTGHTPDKIKSLGQLVGMDSMAKDKIRDALKDPDLDPFKRQVLELRQEYAKASVKKLNSFMLHQLDGRIHDGFIYGGAERTLRWTGGGVQPQNMARGAGKPSLEAFDTLLETRQLPDVVEDSDGNRFTSAQDKLKSMVRGFIKAPLLVGDFSQIEARILAWIAGDEKILHAFATGLDPYKIKAADIYHIPVEEVTKAQRFMGKQTVLGCGYGLGKYGFMNMLDVVYDVQVSEEDAAHAVNSYRNSSPKVVSFWHRVEAAIAKSKSNLIKGKNPGLWIDADKWLGVRWTDRETFFILLPSGGRAWYHEVKRGSQGMTCFGRLKKGGYGRVMIYGGAVTGHIVQRTARDAMGHALLNLEAAGMPPVLTVHDEAGVIGPESLLEEFKRIMKIVPPWLEGLPLDVDCFWTPRYRK